MARGTAEEVAEVRGRIRDHAMRLFAEHGYAGTSLSAIAEAAGVSKALVLYHYGGKDALRLEVFQDLVTHWTDLPPRVLAAVQAGTDPLEAALASAIGFLRADPHLARFLMRELLRPDGVVSQTLRDQTMPATELAAAALAQLRGGEAPDDGADPAAALIGMGLVLTAVFAVFPPQPDGALGTDGLGDRVLEQVVRGLKHSLG